MLGCQLQVAQDKLKRIVAIKDRELNEKTEKIQQATDKLAEANERIWLYEDISDSFDKVSGTGAGLKTGHCEKVRVNFLDFSKSCQQLLRVTSVGEKVRASEPCREGVHW